LYFSPLKICVSDIFDSEKTGESYSFPQDMRKGSRNIHIRPWHSSPTEPILIQSEFSLEGPIEYRPDSIFNQSLGGIEMRISKLLLAVSLGALLSPSAFAQQQAPPQGNSAQGQSGGTSDSGVKLDVTPFFEVADTNKDNKITLDEWKAAGLDEAVYEKFDKEKTGYISKESLAEKTHPPEIDENKDGKFSVAELKAHIKRQSQQSGGAPAAGGAQGSAPKK
jgi:hypothetical protein